MWDPASQTKFANNEPARPFFKSSQINIFNEELRGDGVQHVALTVADIVTAVRGLRGAGHLHATRAATTTSCRTDRPDGIGAIDEDLTTLRELEILVDGDHHHAYMLQSSSRSRRPVRRPERRAVLLRDHPAQGRPRVRRRQLPRAVREHRARAAGRGLRLRIAPRTGRGWH